MNQSTGIAQLWEEMGRKTTAAAVERQFFDWVDYAKAAAGAVKV